MSGRAIETVRAARAPPGSGARARLLAAATVALAAWVPASAAELSAAEIVERNVAARGGLEAWRGVETMVWSGRIESARGPAPSMPFRLEQKRPNRTRFEVDALGRKSVRVFDGVHGWKLHSGSGRARPEPYTLLEVKSAQAGHGIDGPLIDHAAKGNSVTLDGVDQIEGRKAYRLSVHLARGGDEQVWVDAESFLDLRYDRMVGLPSGGERRVSTTYGDYRTVDGLRIPFLISTGGGAGMTPDRMRLESALLNAPLEDSTFGSPAAPRARHRAGRSSGTP